MDTPENQLGRRNLTRSRRSSSLEGVDIESPVETATTSARLLPRKPPGGKYVEFDAIPPTASESKHFVNGGDLKSYVARSEK